jgi:hypothetical protein
MTTMTVMMMMMMMMMLANIITNSSYKRFSVVDYAMLCNDLSNYDWPSLYNETSVDAAVDRINVAITQAADLVVPTKHIIKHKYPSWISGKLEAYIKKKNYFYRR